MFTLIAAADPTSIKQAETQFVVALVSFVVLMVILAIDLKYLRESRKIAKDMNLPKGQWLRTIKYLPFDPILEIVVVGVILAKDLSQNWEHVVVAILGAAVGVVVGHYRYRIQYVRAVPEHKAIIFVRSREEYIALTLLIVVRIAAEQHQIPVVGPLTLLITFLLALVVFESIGRTWFAWRRYKADCAAMQPSPVQA